ncbi:hypothetical protein TIFTF001_034364 [Ficus carica]|uniref:Uncharacterized protein n=1 Tax=Ficus carica TaxID=3494 RepID=A0AA88J8F7_FICCA|nr:hypothetical protein TIFTF001_043125 [Ficus carica]GMN20613.1 hypothetical protein TIFTF001_043130 [Ficus carica]GMN65284.1 hypothetical protein TIFTF001_034364 [Ficus carica]
MGLFYRIIDKVAEQKVRIKELEDINKELVEKDSVHEEKLLDIERKFKDVKSSTEGLTSKLQKIMHEAKEGTDMMEIMVRRFDEAQAKIKITILDAFEKATLKPRYDLLKEYRQGLLVDAEVDEEIELYEDTLDDAGCSSYAPIEALPTTNVQ